MTLAELPAWAFELLEESRIAHLGLVDDDGFARVLPVTYVVHDGALWTVVDEKPKRRRGAELARVRWLRARPRATVTVDRYDDDWSRLAWVQVVGEIAVLDLAAHEATLEALARRYEPYRRRRPPGPLLRLTPQRAVCWRAAGDG